MGRILTLCLILVVSGAGFAQTSRPASKPTSKPAQEKKLPAEPLKRDPAALKLYESITKALYRPRDSGLITVQFNFAVHVALPDGRTLDYGPYEVTWNAKTGHQVKIAGEIKPGMVKPEQISQAFLQSVVNDLVGWTPADMTKGRHIELSKNKDVVIRVTKEEAKRGNVRQIILTPDKAGRLGTQSVLGVKDYPLMIREYDYLGNSKRTLVENVRIRSGKTRKVKTHTYVELEGFTFPKKISSQGAEQGVQDITYSAIKVIKKASQ